MAHSSISASSATPVLSRGSQGPLCWVSQPGQPLKISEFMFRLPGARSLRRARGGRHPPNGVGTRAPDGRQDSDQKQALAPNHKAPAAI